MAAAATVGVADVAHVADLLVMSLLYTGAGAVVDDVVAVANVLLVAMLLLS